MGKHGRNIFHNSIFVPKIIILKIIGVYTWLDLKYLVLVLVLIIEVLT